MPEAEDVLLEMAERTTSVARRLWQRNVEAAASPGLALESRRRVLSLWLLACWGRDWPIVATDAPPRPGWLERRLGDPGPWRRSPRAPALTDGLRLYVPRSVDLGRGPEQDEELLRLLVLGLGSRLERGAHRALPGSAAARDLFWAAEGAVADARLARALPGLAPPLRRLRERARRERPEARLLRPAERQVEGAIRRLLEGPGSDPERVLGPDLAPVALAHWAAVRAPRDAARYRGAAPVLHWGGACDSPAEAIAPSARGGEASRPGRSRTLTRWLRPRAPEPEEADDRSGPFVLPFSDPHGAVQDARGLRRPEDGAEGLDLDVLAEELASQAELLRIRSERRTHEVLADEEGDGRAPRAAPAAVPAPTDPEVAGLFYPEWDHRTQAYRPAHCRVLPGDAPEGDADFAARVRREQHALHRRIRREFESLRPRRVRQPRQRDGSEVDIEAWVDAWTSRRAGSASDDRLYCQDRPVRRDVALTLLIDASASTDATTTGTKRVIDVEKEATLCFGDALDRLGDRFSALAFSSRGPRHVRVETIKAFGARWNGTAERRLAGLEPGAFTRLGGALRHATAELAREPARHRLLLLLSDGRPDDEDEYEGSYGLEDVRQAVAEARLQRVRVFCLNVDRHGAHWLPRLFGPGSYAVLPRVEQLTEKLPALYRALTT